MRNSHSISSLILKAIEQQPTIKKIGLLDGLTGESLYYFYRSELYDDNVAYEKAVEKLQTAIEISNKNSVDPSFYSGITGIGWMVLHLKEQKLVDIDIDDFLDRSVDAYLYKVMLDFLNQNIYDFFFGASGICYYFFKKYQCFHDESIRKTYKTYIMHYLFYMEFLKKIDQKGILWKHHEYPFDTENSYYELSSLSNVSSIILLLSEIATEEEFAPFCKLLVQKASNQLLYKLEVTQKHRLDQGYCLWKASVLLHDPKLEEKGLHYLNLAKNNIQTTDLISLTKCALIYQKIAETTNNKSLDQETLKYLKKVNDQLYTHYDNSIWKGCTGIGLIDLSCNHNISSEWSKCMLI